jgi:hypothetical protein
MPNAGRGDANACAEEGEIRGAPDRGIVGEPMSLAPEWKRVIISIGEMTDFEKS